MHTLRVLTYSRKLNISTNRGIIVDAIEESVNEGDEAKATRIAQQLMVATPEFHSWGTVHENSGKKRKIRGYTEPPKHPYKTVVVFMVSVEYLILARILIETLYSENWKYHKFLLIYLPHSTLRIK